MPEEIGVDPIADDEILFRRIPESQGWYDPKTRSISPNAFRPTKEDVTGLSLYRNACMTPEAVGHSGRRGDRRYFVACLVAGDVRRYGMTPRQDHPKTDPGHVEIVELRYDNRRSDESDQLMGLLVNAASGHSVHGPFVGGDGS